MGGDGTAREAERATTHHWLGGIEASEAMESLVLRRSGMVARTAMPGRLSWPGVVNEGCDQRGSDRTKIPGEKATSVPGLGDKVTSRDLV